MRGIDVRCVFSFLLFVTAALALIFSITSFSYDSDADRGRIIITVNENLTYDGDEITVGSSGCDIIYETDYTVEPYVEFRSYGSGGWGPYVTDHPVNAGQHLIRLTFSGDVYDDTFEEKIFEIHQKDIAVSSNPDFIPMKTYDGMDSCVSYGNFYTFSGVLDKDADSIGLSAKFTFSDAQAGVYKDVAVSEMNLTGTSGVNYNLITSSLAMKGNIIQRSILIIPDSGQSKTFGEKEPVITYRYHNTVSGEIPEFSGCLSRTSGEDAGRYSIIQGTLALSENGQFIPSNYVISIPESYFTIKTVIITEQMFKADLSDSEYTGKSITKTVTSDVCQTFYVCYFNNIQIGTATLKVIGSGNYSGTLSMNFRIIERTVDIPESIYYLETGGKIMFTDFPVSEWYSETSRNPKEGTLPGTYDYRLRLMGGCHWASSDYTGDYQVYITVKEKTVSDSGKGIDTKYIFENGVRTDLTPYFSISKDISQTTADSLKGIRGTPVYSIDMKMLSDDTVVPVSGKVTVRISIPEDLRGDNIAFYATTDSGTVGLDHDVDGDYAEFEMDELSECTIVKVDDSSVPALVYVVIGVIALLAAIIIIVALKKKKHL